MSLTPDSTSEKQHIEQKEFASRQPTNLDAEGQSVDPAFAKKTVRKIDWNLIPILSALYCISLIDRTNVSVARLLGMAKELKLTVGERYSIITLIFFVPYIIFELPSNLIIRKLGPRNQLAAITVLWGSVMLGMGFVKTWEQLAVCRVLLGVLEAGFFPGCTFLISTWYLREEAGRRMAWFYLSSMVVSGFSNIMGWGIGQLSGKHGYLGWRWVFIVFGAITIGLGIISWFIIVDFPDRAKFLTDAERKYAVDRVNADRGDALPDGATAAKVLKHLADFKIWLFGLCFCFATTGSYAFAFFLPVILAGGGYDTKTSLLLSAPPYAAAAIYTAVVAHYSDKTRRRAPFIAGSAILCSVGLLILAYAKPLGVRYFGAFFTIMGCQSNVPGVLAYGSTNVLSHSKKAVNSAIIVGLGGVGGIMASTIFRQADYPKYIPGLWGTIGCQWATCIILVGLSFYFKRQNAKADRGEHVIEGNPSFRYTI
ncbi:Major facilitator superfamily domain-containing protein [Rhodotorula toruloides]|uniref:Major facilitator superfamily domain-containing protein n=1 Tax=Rhodotorula toruloides TaxID=5286 RepID=A0A2T0A1F9_RHOTO|nr:Major facilitator superfamily domain-containing protein [Rhodotorula toruloides]PRQ71823.1 Major facilitator superfamily domain-containing protein [Rhodotorula toruloides]